MAELTRLGRNAVTLDLPGDGTHPMPPDRAKEEDFHACFDAAILASPGPVALIGHSGGGMLVTAAATRHPSRVSNGIWLAGMLIPDGRSFDQICAEVAGAGAKICVTPHIQASPDGLTSTVPPEAAIAHFFDDFPPNQARAAAARLTPQPTSGHRIATKTGPQFAALPKLYLLATRDKSVLPAVQRHMCAGVENLTLRQIDSGHVPQVTKPRALAALIDRWLPKPLRAEPIPR